jgi:hypothetical protein
MDWSGGQVFQPIRRRRVPAENVHTSTSTCSTSLKRLEAPHNVIRQSVLRSELSLNCARRRSIMASRIRCQLAVTAIEYSTTSPRSRRSRVQDTASAVSHHRQVESEGATYVRRPEKAQSPIERGAWSPGWRRPPACRLHLWLRMSSRSLYCTLRQQSGKALTI